MVSYSTFEEEEKNKILILVSLFFVVVFLTSWKSNLRQECNAKGGIGSADRCHIRNIMTQVPKDEFPQLPNSLVVLPKPKNVVDVKYMSCHSYGIIRHKCKTTVPRRPLLEQASS